MVYPAGKRREGVGVMKCERYAVGSSAGWGGRAGCGGCGFRGGVGSAGGGQWREGGEENVRAAGRGGALFSPAGADGGRLNSLPAG